MMEPATLGFAESDLFSSFTCDRIERIWKPCWIDYPLGQEALLHLERLMAHPKSFRPPCCLIYGESNHGKTTIARKFERVHSVADDPENDARRMPVAYVQSPPMADVSGLYTNILDAIGSERRPTWTAARKLDQVLTMLTQLGTRMLIVDELHNILHGKVDQRGIYLNVLKHLTNELQIPIVGIGTKEVLRVVQTDQQMGNRFEPFHIPKWKLGKDFGMFLASICRHAGVEDVSFVRNRSLVKRVHIMSEGLTGETWKVMCRALERMDELGKKVLDVEILDDIDWTAPKDRRGQV